MQVIEEREMTSSYKQQSTISVERERLRASEGEKRGQGERELRPREIANSANATHNN